MPIEFLIKRSDGEWWDLDQHYADWLRPTSFAVQAVDAPGPYTITIDGVEVSIADEGDFGFQVSFPDGVPRDWARRVVEEILQNVSKRTGQSGRIVEIS